MKKNTSVILLLIATLILPSCDPGLTGNLKVFNHSDSVITVTVKSYSGSKNFTIPPDSNALVKTIGRLGDKSEFKCCPCEADTIYISTASGSIKKDASQTDHWTIPNSSKLKRFGGEEIRCELHIMPSDI